MDKNQLIERGRQNIVDARFIQEQFIPLALREEHWNIVVFEAYRVIEHLVKGMICLSGNDPKGERKKGTHNIDELVDDFNGILYNTKVSLPFTYSWLSSSQSGFGVTVTGNEIYIFRAVSGSFTTLSSQTSQDISDDELLQMRIELSNSLLKVHAGDKLVMEQTSSSITDLSGLERKFEKHPDFERLATLKDAVKKLKDAGTKLRSNREPAEYSMKKFFEQDAKDAISLMEIATEASNTMFKFEPL